MKKKNGNSKSSPFKKRNPEEYINPSSERPKQIPSPKISRQSPERPRRPSSPKKDKTPYKKKPGMIKRLFLRFPIL
tara:strand:+ start:2186 stop:2413 length:228 start_codon:yes stop_codon:yes gene_type:complete